VEIIGAQPVFNAMVNGVLMHSAIVIDEIGTQAAVVDTTQLLDDVKAFADILVASTQQAPEGFSTGMWITAETLPEAVAQAVSIAASKRVFMVNSALVFTETDLSKLVPEIENRNLNEHIIVAPALSNSSVSATEFSPESIVAMLQSSSAWPLMSISTSRSTMTSACSARNESVIEIMARAMITAISDGDYVRTTARITPLVNPETLSQLCTLSNAAKARCLRAAIDGMNIEELFPKHDWRSFSEESAAASYHSLAALFLHFQDPNSAAQCLACSEKLEESPRYFALQALIQQAQGETLGAVANLVSSLQCYEARKSADGKHYLNFKPSNLEIIKTRLAEGLDALNKRDNDRALASFSDAVFSFDSFYSEHGVQNPSKTEN
jgi:hypothetical protein